MEAVVKSFVGRRSRRKSRSGEGYSYAGGGYSNEMIKGYIIFYSRMSRVEKEEAAA